jgi:hypothetical protein
MILKPECPYCQRENNVGISNNDLKFECLQFSERVKCACQKSFVVHGRSWTHGAAYQISLVNQGR